MKNDYDELETYNHNNDDYNEYDGQMSMTYDDLNRLIISKVRGSMIWMVIGLLITGGIGFMVYNGAIKENPIAYMIIEKYWIFLILEVADSNYKYAVPLSPTRSDQLLLLLLQRDICEENHLCKVNKLRLT